MKKIIILFLFSVFTSYFTKAQTFYVKNTTSIGPLDVYDIKKFGISCVGSSYCMMTNMTGISGGGSASQAYPALCNSVPDIEISFDYNGASILNLQFCGTTQTGTIGGANYDLYATGVGTEVVLYIY